ncbi:MAG TPA: hypothetical protein VNZ44_11965, partial [Pyrinomonadaceae bacterium]|nr:hypothetical protein [Pyrinomonadaceae bacterium]
MKWEEILGWIFRGGLRRGARVGAAAAPKLARGAAADALAGQVGRTAFRIFKSNLLALPWVGEGEELSRAVEGARADLLRSRNA